MRVLTYEWKQGHLFGEGLLFFGNLCPSPFGFFVEELLELEALILPVVPFILDTLYSLVKSRSENLSKRSVLFHNADPKQ